MTYPEPTPSDVSEIMDTSLDTTSLQAHIDAASHEVSEIELNDPTIDDARLTDIHKYLSAYYATGQEPRASSQSGESRSISYATDESADYYGIAKRLDPTGLLEDNQRRTATLSTPDTKDIYD